MSVQADRVALVTGASRGIGAACARRLAADGYAVGLNTLPHGEMRELGEQVAAEIQQGGGRAAVCSGDVSDPAGVDQMFEQCESDLGPVHALVLNAAATARRAWTDIADEEWDRILAVNLTGAFLCSRRAFGSNAASEGGAIVTVSSVLARIGATNALHYTTTKAGLEGFTRSLARELGPRGIRVNCVMPGAIRTEEELESFPDQREVERRTLEVQALQRRGLPEDIASVVSFLVGPDSAFVTGQTVCVDGGWISL